MAAGPARIAKVTLSGVVGAVGFSATVSRF